MSVGMLVSGALAGAGTGGLLAGPVLCREEVRNNWKKFLAMELALFAGSAYTGYDALQVQPLPAAVAKYDTNENKFLDLPEARTLVHEVIDRDKNGKMSNAESSFSWNWRASNFSEWSENNSASMDNYHRAVFEFANGLVPKEEKK